MRQFSLLVVLTAASLSVAAQQQKPQPQPQTANTPDKELVDRARVDGSAGGTAPVPPEKRKAVGAGAGPHRKDNLPSPQKLPKDEPVQPPK